MSTSPTDPIVIHTRIFQADDGWRFVVTWWIGNVDVASHSPTGVFESKRAWPTRRSAVRLAAELSSGIGGA